MELTSTYLNTLCNELKDMRFNRNNNSTEIRTNSVFNRLGKENIDFNQMCFKSVESNKNRHQGNYTVKPIFNNVTHFYANAENSKCEVTFVTPMKNSYENTHNRYDAVGNSLNSSYELEDGEVITPQRIVEEREIMERNRRIEEWKRKYIMECPRFDLRPMLKKKRRLNKQAIKKINNDDRECLKVVANYIPYTYPSNIRHDLFLQGIKSKSVEPFVRNMRRYSWIIELDESTSMQKALQIRTICGHDVYMYKYRDPKTTTCKHCNKIGHLPEDCATPKPKKKIIVKYLAGVTKAQIRSDLWNKNITVEKIKRFINKNETLNWILSFESDKKFKRMLTVTKVCGQNVSVETFNAASCK